MSKALVLGGGGLTGIAWELGVLAALNEAGVDVVATTDVIVGTSAGSCVGAQITSGAGYAQLCAAQLVPAEQSGEIHAELDLDRLIEIFKQLYSAGGDPQAVRATVGSMAIATPTVTEDERRQVIASRLPTHEWPEKRLLVTAVDAGSGELVVFDRQAGVPLVDAVTASCAVPGVWPPATIGSRRYIDGGVRSPTNADLAGGHDRILVLNPVPAGGSGAMLEKEIAGLGEASSVLVVTADDASVAAFGTNPLDPSRRAPALEAGRRLARDLGDAVRDHWTP